MFQVPRADLKSNAASLRLDLPEVAYASRQGKNGIMTPIVPGHPEQSEAWRRISTDDQIDRMPPAYNLHQLTARDKAVIKRWIEQGAEYQSHLAYIPPQKLDLPKVQNALWPRNPVDHFILSELEGRGIEPSVEADRVTLIRRLSLDLIGLPPAPDEVRAFVEDDSPDAYEQLVDRLLSSPHTTVSAWPYPGWTSCGSLIPWGSTVTRG